MIDIKLLNDNDIDLSFGDIQYVESTEQHQRDLLVFGKGFVRDRPEVGIDSLNYLHDNNSSDYLRSIRKEFSVDGMKVKKIILESSTIVIDADYEN